MNLRERAKENEKKSEGAAVPHCPSQMMREFNGHTASVSSVETSPDKRRVCSLFALRDVRRSTSNSMTVALATGIDSGSDGDGDIV